MTTVHVYNVFVGTISRGAASTGVTVNVSPLQIPSCLSEIIGRGSTVTVSSNVGPSHPKSDTGVIVYTTS